MFCLDLDAKIIRKYLPLIRFIRVTDTQVFLPVVKNILARIKIFKLHSYDIDVHFLLQHRMARMSSSTFSILNSKMDSPLQRNLHNQQSLQFGIWNNPSSISKSLYDNGFYSVSLPVFGFLTIWIYFS